PAPQAAVVQQRAAMVDSSLSEDVALLAKQISGANSARVRPCSTDTPWYTNSAPAEKTKESLLYAALCAQTLRDSDMLVISDVSRDPRSRGSVLSSGGGPMRFFAGVPLILFDGLRFGTLTICDRKPRELTTEQRRALLALSRQTVACLELRRREAEADAAGASLSARPVTRDLLTGLQNRAALHESVLRGIAHATRHAEKLAFLYVDLDNFRGVNESYGRPVGDAFLVETGKRLLASVRGSDTVARLGGDEFAVLINGLHSADDAMHVAQKLIRSLSLPFDANGRRWSASCSIGVSVFPLDGGDGESLLRHADTAMYRAKSAGKGGYALFTANGSRH
ncbi:MAG TPA: sensor domain-containing diguanylate cyclase, partial [Pyrinomonadaceae bacterium]|nr:sensor domain-containing diguanylate cyclase [Pyrinomonadaceae bacterium]